MGSLETQFGKLDVGIDVNLCPAQLSRPLKDMPLTLLGNAHEVYRRFTPR
jgi:hypothetical protein